MVRFTSLAVLLATLSIVGCEDADPTLALDAGKDALVGTGGGDGSSQQTGADAGAQRDSSSPVDDAGHDARDAGTSAQPDASSDSGPNDAGSGHDGGGSPGFCAGEAPANLPTCTATAQCTNNFEECVIVAPDFSCGGAAPFTECGSDGDCLGKSVCLFGSCGESTCIAACPTAPCETWESCSAGHCEPKACDAAGAQACDNTRECKPSDGAGDDRGCTPAPCDSSSYTCPSGWDCTPASGSANANGCVHRACVERTDCDCGSCVNERCEARPGFCANTAPPP